MIRRDEADGWVVFYDDDGVTERFRCKPPPGGLSLDDFERFREFLLREAKKNEAGPS